MGKEQPKFCYSIGLRFDTYFSPCDVNLRRCSYLSIDYKCTGFCAVVNTVKNCKSMSCVLVVWKGTGTSGMVRIRF